MVGLEPQFSVFYKVADLHSFYSSSLCSFWFCDHLAEDKGTGCFTITVSLRLCVCPRLYSTAMAGHTHSPCANPEKVQGFRTPSLKNHKDIGFLRPDPLTKSQS